MSWEKFNPDDTENMNVFKKINVELYIFYIKRFVTEFEMLNFEVSLNQQGHFLRGCPLQLQYHAVIVTDKIQRLNVQDEYHSKREEETGFLEGSKLM